MHISITTSEGREQEVFTASGRKREVISELVKQARAFCPYSSFTPSPTFYSKGRGRGGGQVAGVPEFRINFMLLLDLEMNSPIIRYISNAWPSETTVGYIS